MLYDYYIECLGEIPDFIKPYLESPSMQRLKGISFFCGMEHAPDELYHFNEKLTRYDHSLSTALITWRLTNDKKATLAALFHDIATPCFSHVVDYLNGDFENQESTEEFTDLVIKNDKVIVDLLNRDGYAISEIADFKKYSIVDLDRPGLCADRLDGLMFTGMVWTKHFSKEEIKIIVDGLCSYCNEDNKLEIGFSSRDAYLLVVFNSYCMNKYCHSNVDNYLMGLLKEITKLAIDNKVIEYEDLFKLREDELFNILENCNVIEVTDLLEKFRTIKYDDIPKEVSEGDMKKRVITPLINGVRVKK